MFERFVKYPPTRQEEPQVPKSVRNQLTLAALDNCQNKSYELYFQGPRVDIQKVVDGKEITVATYPHARLSINCDKFSEEPEGSSAKLIDIPVRDVDFDRRRGDLADQLGCLACPHRIEEIDPSTTSDC